MERAEVEISFPAFSASGVARSIFRGVLYTCGKKKNKRNEGLCPNNILVIFLL